MYSAAFTGINEPSLDELFAEPMIQLIMRRDGIAQDTLEQALKELAELKARRASLQ